MRKIIGIWMMLSALTLSAQRYEAENGAHQGNVSDGFVEIRDDADYAQVSFSLSSVASYDIYIGYRSPYGDKEATVTVNGLAGTVAIPQTEYSTEVKYATMNLQAGNNTIRVSAPWTWFDVDYVRIAVGSGGGGGGVTPSSGHGFYVYGTQLLDAKNNPFVIRGTNLAYAWYKGHGFRNQIAQMRSRGANAVRIALSDGQQYSKDGSGTIQSMISYCEQQKMIAILDVHDATGSNDVSALNAAVNYWKEMKSALAGHEHTVIINIANEWCGEWNSANWATGYKSAISALRQAGIKNCLMVDASGWGQQSATITFRGQEILNADPDKNIIFSVHMYGVAGKPGIVESTIQNIQSQNLCLCIGEFGWYHSDGDVDEDAIISTCKNKKVGWCSWSWWGNGSPVQYLDMVTDQDNGTPATQSTAGQTCNWGQKIYNAWVADGQLCTVYTDAPAQPDPVDPGGGVESLHMTVPQPKKILHDGQVYIIRGEHIYTIQGQRIR